MKILVVRQPLFRTAKLEQIFLSGLSAGFFDWDTIICCQMNISAYMVS